MTAQEDFLLNELNLNAITKSENKLYRFEPVLGQGGFGIVYKCRKTTGTVVAIKKIKNRDACWTEISIMRKLRGREYEQYFVQCIDVHRTKVALYLVMEYCPDGSLEQFVKRHGSFHPLILVNHIAQLVKGLGKMHHLGLMHRDLKPENILMTTRNRNNGFILKIADFGVSKEVVANLAIYQTICGTPCYMAPEVLEGHAYDKSADIYSLGGIIFFMRWGQHPIGLNFDKCGYPISIAVWSFSNHKTLYSLMMCKRKEQRLKLEDLEIWNAIVPKVFRLVKRLICSICKTELQIPPMMMGIMS